MDCMLQKCLLHDRPRIARHVRDVRHFVNFVHFDPIDQTVSLGLLALELVKIPAKTWIKSHQVPCQAACLTNFRNRLLETQFFKFLSTA